MTTKSDAGTASYAYQLDHHIDRLLKHPSLAGQVDTILSLSGLYLPVCVMSRADERNVTAAKRRRCCLPQFP
jgi:hypothetical protein